MELMLFVLLPFVTAGAVYWLAIHPVLKRNEALSKEVAELKMQIADFGNPKDFRDGLARVNQYNTRLQDTVRQQVNKQLTDGYGLSLDSFHQNPTLNSVLDRVALQIVNELLSSNSPYHPEFVAKVVAVAADRFRELEELPGEIKAEIYQLLAPRLEEELTNGTWEISDSNWDEVHDYVQEKIPGLLQEVIERSEHPLREKLVEATVGSAVDNIDRIFDEVLSWGGEEMSQQLRPILHTALEDELKKPESELRQKLVESAIDQLISQ